jgi:predicted phage tail protein
MLVDGQHGDKHCRSKELSANVTAQQAVLLAAVVGASLIVAGVAMSTGAAWALVAAGVLTLAGAVVLYDPVKRP